MPAEAPPLSTTLSLRPPFQGPLRRMAFSLVAPVIDRCLGLDRLRETYAEVAGAPEAKAFLARVISRMGIEIEVHPEGLARVPASGPLVVVANHPFGGVEGVVLASLLFQVRDDIRVLANHLLGNVPELRPLFVPVDPFGGSRAAEPNVRGLREAVRHLKGGGALLTFPAGEVSHFDLGRGGVSDRVWSATVPRLARLTGALTMPVFVAGSNGPFFQLAGLVHPRLRTALLPREFLNKQNHRLEIRFGKAIAAEQLSRVGDDPAVASFLRQRTYLLGCGHRSSSRVGRGRPRAGARPAPVGPPRVPPRALAEEVDRLPAEQRLIANGPFEVYVARGDQLSALLDEIGRLRESTFRAVGEGTGKDVDLDSFDGHYHHLFLWQRERGEVAGAYRLGATDAICSRLGTRGLYTSTLFHLSETLIDRINPALELGRSFICIEYQRSYAPLLLLWSGIGRFVAEHSRYRYLFGPVSISQGYRPISQQLMVAFLRVAAAEEKLGRVVRPRRPHRPVRAVAVDTSELLRHLKDADELSDLISEIESDGKGLPVLVRHYLKLGGKVLDFNVDPAFSNTVDALTLVDLTRTERRLLDRYMGREGAARFLAFHGEQAPLSWPGEPGTA
jgi:putative hemolysin